MDKFIGTILMMGVIIICFYVVLNLDKINDLVFPVPEKVVDYFKVQPFNPSASTSPVNP